LFVEQTGQVFHLGAQVGDLAFEAEAVQAWYGRHAFRVANRYAFSRASWAEKNRGFGRDEAEALINYLQASSRELPPIPWPVGPPLPAIRCRSLQPITRVAPAPLTPQAPGLPPPPLSPPPTGRPGSVAGATTFADDTSAGG